MKPVAKASSAALAAEALRHEIASGHWDDRLPGARVLASRLKVSAPTVAAALAMLVREGLLVRAGERRSYRLAGARRATARTNAVDAKRLLILIPEALVQLTEISQKVLAKLRERMTGKGWTVDWQVLDFLHAKTARRSWDRLIQVDKGTSVIALHGRPPLAEWAVRRKVRMLFLGGATNGLPVPIVAVSSSQMAEIALARLTSLGHWRIVMPLCDRAESFRESLRAVTRRAIESVGRAYIQSYHNPERDYLSPDVTWRVIQSAFDTDPPTALVLLDWKELVTAQCYLSHQGLRVPDDISLVLLNDQTDAEWYHPALSRFRFPEKRLVRAMVSWLEDDQPAGTLSTADFVEGATIAEPRRKFNPSRRQSANPRPV